MELKTQARIILGKKVKSLRKQGLIPAELYGHQTENRHLAVFAKEFQKIFKEAGESTIINLATDENQIIPAMIYEVQTDPLSDQILNVDFYQIKMSEKICVPVPFVFAGEAPAVKNFGGILVKTLQEIEIEALPADLPHNIQIDLTKLDAIGKNIAVKDLPANDKIKFLSAPETIIATVVEAQTEEAAAEKTPTAETTTAETPATENKTESSNATAK